MRNTVLVTIQKALAELGQDRPQIAVSSEDQDVKQMLALLVALCDELQQMQNWNELITTHTFTTVAGQQAYPLPYDFSRLANGTIWNKTTQMPIAGPSTDEAWSAMKNGTTAGPVCGHYRVAGNKLHLIPAPEAGQPITFEYISAYYVMNAGDYVPKADFTNDADNYVFDDRLVINGLKLKYNESKGFETSNYLSDFNTSLEAVRSFNGSSGHLNVGGRGRCMPLIGLNNIPDGNWK